MSSKFYTLVLYGLSFATLLIYQIILKKNRSISPPSKKGSYFLIGFLTIANLICVYLLRLHEQKNVLTLIAVLSITCVFIINSKNITGKISTISTAFLSLSLCFSLIWWRFPPIEKTFVIGINEYIFFSCTFLIVASILLWKKTGFKVNCIFLIIPIFLAFILSFTTVPQDNDLTVTMTTWHHWAAYIGPSELMLAGAIPYVDFPLQYGMGPTVLVALACSAFQNCWIGNYYLFGSAIFLYTVTFFYLILKINQKITLQTYALIFIALVSCIFWTSYPPNVDTPLLTPSTSGMRFLPVLLVVSWLLGSRYRFNLKKINTLVPLLLWLLCIVWSPEAAFMGTVVFSGIYIADFVHFTKLNTVKVFLQTSYKVALIFIVLVLFLISIFYVFTGEILQPRILIIYMLYPPGEMPVNWHGPIYFYIFTIVYSVFISNVTESYTEFRKSLILQLLAISALSYFLGRSHDNNILNIIPFAFLLMADSLHKSNSLEKKVVPTIFLAFLITATFLFGWNHWSKNLKHYGFHEQSFSELYKKFSYEKTILPLSPKEPEIIKQLKEENEIANIIIEKGEKYEFLNTRGAILPIHGLNNVWSGMHTYINFRFIPHDDQIQFLKKTSQRLNRDGWLIVGDNLSDELKNVLNAYDAVYKRTDIIQFQSSYAIKYQVKTENNVSKTEHSN